MSQRTLDHVVTVVPDLDASADVFEGLGFSVTERSDHPFGTSNRLIVLDNGYIELVAVTDQSLIPPDGFARFVADAFEEERFGPLMLVFGSDDPQADHRHLLASGLTSSGPLSFGRWVDKPDGERMRAEFVTVFTDIGSKTLSGFYCQHLTPEAVWDTQFMGHPNGAGRITRVVVNDPGPEPWGRLSQIAEGSNQRPIELSDVTLDTGSQEIEVTADILTSATVAATTIELVNPT